MGCAAGLIWFSRRSNERASDNPTIVDAKWADGYRIQLQFADNATGVVDLSRLAGNRRIGSAAFSLIKVDPARLGATEVVRTPDGIDVLYSSRARSLVDAVYDWTRFGSLPCSPRRLQIPGFPSLSIYRSTSQGVRSKPARHGLALQFPIVASDAIIEK
jgi:hypothetical protein